MSVKCPVTRGAQAARGLGLSRGVARLLGAEIRGETAFPGLGEAVCPSPRPFSTPYSDVGGGGRSGDQKRR